MDEAGERHRGQGGVRRLVLRTTAEHRGLGLESLLLGWLPLALGEAVARSSVRRLIMSGNVRVAGHPTRRPGWVPGEGHVVEARVDPGRLRRPREPDFLLGPERVLFEDAALLAVDKPAGLPTVPTADPARLHLVGAVCAYLATRRPGGGSYVGVHQRLDQGTSGVVLFATDREANASLSAQFASREVEKSYLALVAAPPGGLAGCRRLEDELGPVGRGRVGVVEGGSRAVTDVRLVEELVGALLVEARPRTGRKHQIRAQFARVGAPILGDTVYGGGRPGFLRPLLHAASLRLRHPLSGAVLQLESPLPADFVAALDELRRGSPGPRGRR